MDGLPTRLNLAKRGLNIEAKCPLCEKALESTSHALIQCDKLGDVWWNWHTCPVNLLGRNINLVDLALEILEAGTPQDLEIFFATAWSIWLNRNKVVHESGGFSPSKIWNITRCTREDYSDAVACCILKQQPPDVGWVAPSPEFYKINVGGATTGERSMSCAGVVIRDCRGLVIAAGSKVLNGAYVAEVTKALVVEEGIHLAKELELLQVIIESDSVVVVDAISASNCNGELGPIVLGSLELLRSFKSWKVRHLKRDYSMATHDLAQVAKATRIFQQWRGSEPPMIQRVLLVDRAKC